MKIRYCSDLHLEFQIRFTDNMNNMITPMEDDKNTVLILMGDIHVGEKVIPVLQYLAERFKDVIYVLGNHEYYNNNYYLLFPKLLELKSNRNIHILNNNRVIIDGMQFIGSTLWSDMDNNNPISIDNIQKTLNDYRAIGGRNIGSALTPDETIDAHEEALEYLQRKITRDSIVITHHAPLRNVSNPMFKDSPIAGAFESSLERLIVDTQPKYWLYGHTHYNHVDIYINDTIIATNQYGYPHEIVENYDAKKIIEV